MRRPFLYLLPLLLIVPAGFGAWALLARHDSRATRLDAAPIGMSTFARNSDTAVETWNMPLPALEPEAPPVTARPVVEPAPDWSALRADVAAVDANVPAVASTTAPAEMEIAMSARERRALIASAKEGEMEPGPRGYRPGIAVIVPGGSTSGGVCR